MSIRTAVILDYVAILYSHYEGENALEYAIGHDVKLNLLKAKKFYGNVIDYRPRSVDEFLSALKGGDIAYKPDVSRLEFDREIISEIALSIDPDKYDYLEKMLALNTIQYLQSAVKFLNSIIKKKNATKNDDVPH